MPTDIIPIIKDLGPLVAAIAIGTGAWQYRKAQQWKHAEFVATEVMNMKSDTRVKIFMALLDWDGRRVELFPEEEGDKKFAHVSHTDLAKALRPHNKDTIFTDEEVALRDLADEFLDRFERFDQFSQAGLVNAKAFDPYLRYWLVKMASTVLYKNNDGKNAFHIYIKHYNYQGVQRFMNKLGYVVAWDSVGK